MGSSTDGAANYLAFNLNVSNGGNLNVYLLSTGPDGSSDSFNVQADATTAQQVTTGSAGAWAWKKASSPFSLANGAHTLYVRVREPGAQVDKLFITSGSTAPSGLGGAATSCGSGGGSSGSMLLMRYEVPQISATPVVPATTARTSVFLPLVVQALNASADTPSDTPAPGDAPARLALGPPQTRVTTYQYDGLERLTGASEVTGGTTTASYSYAYDLAGNRTDATSNGVAVHRDYNAANQVLGWQYDAAGNLVNDGTTTYEYGTLNQLLRRGATYYDYTGDGTLVNQRTGSTSTRYTLDRAAPLAQVLQTSVNGAAPTTYLYGTERLASVTSGGARTWYSSDALGSVRLTLDDAGAGVASYRYDPWGVPQGQAPPAFGFTGELQDSAGLVYLRARWYNPVNGTFTGYRWDTSESDDTIPYTHHPYAYALSNPVLYTDPTGRYFRDGHEDPVGCPKGYVFDPVQQFHNGEGCIPINVGGGGIGGNDSNAGGGTYVPPGVFPDAPPGAIPPDGQPPMGPYQPLPNMRPAGPQVEPPAGPGLGDIARTVGAFCTRAVPLVAGALLLSGDQYRPRTAETLPEYIYRGGRNRAKSLSLHRPQDWETGLSFFDTPPPGDFIKFRREVLEAAGFIVRPDALDVIYKLRTADPVLDQNGQNMTFPANHVTVYHSSKQYWDAWHQADLANKGTERVSPQLQAIYDLREP